MNYYRVTLVENPEVVGSGEEVAETKPPLPFPPPTIHKPSQASWMNSLHHLSKIKIENAQTLAEILERGGFPLDNDGYIISEKLNGSFFTIPFLVYAVTGKNKPKNWKRFIRFLASLAFDGRVLCPRIRAEVKRIQNERKKQATSRFKVRT
jgi:hypothetical protein